MTARDAEKFTILVVRIFLNFCYIIGLLLYDTINIKFIYELHIWVCLLLTHVLTFVFCHLVCSTVFFFFCCSKRCSYLWCPHYMDKFVVFPFIHNNNYNNKYCCLVMLYATRINPEAFSALTGVHTSLNKNRLFFCALL